MSRKIIHCDCDCFYAAVEMRDDPLLRPDEFKLVVKGAGRDVTQQYAVA